jgi:hypothetical protein
VVFEAVVMATQAMEVIRRGAAALGEGNAMVEIGVLGWTVAPRELAGPVTQADVLVDLRGRYVPVGSSGRWFIGESDIDPLDAKWTNRSVGAVNRACRE